MHRFEIVDPRRLWRSYLLAIGLLFVLISSSHFATSFLSGDGVRAAQDINMSGRQRMLSQRIIYFGAQVVKSDALDEETLNELRGAHDLFLESHEVLVSQVERPLPNNVYDVYFKETGPQLDQMSRDFAAATLTLLNGTPQERQIAYDYMRDVGPNALLNDLNLAVSAFEEHARLQTHKGEFWGFIGYGLAILALVLEAIFIFRPAQRSIVKAMNSLEDSNEQLKQQEAEAFAALEDAEDAWIEADLSRKKAEAFVETAQDDAARLRKETSVSLSAMQNLLGKASAEKLTLEQRALVNHAQRLNLVSLDIVRDFSDKYAETAQETREKDVVFSLQDIAATAVETIKHQKSAAPVWVHPARDFSTEPKVVGQSSRVLRLVFGTLLAALKSSSAQNAKFDMTVAKEDGNAEAIFTVWVECELPELEADRADALDANEHALIEAYGSVFQDMEAKLTCRAKDQTHLEFSVVWPVKLASSRPARGSKPVRKTRRAS